MKLAEALILRADLQRRIAQLQRRVLDNATIQEGDTPAEQPNKLLMEFEKSNLELVSLIQRINRTNANTQLEDGLSLADALAVRDSLLSLQRTYRNLAEAGIINQNRYSRSEVKFVSNVNVTEMQSKADQLAKEHRELDTKIQSANWLTDLL